MRHLFVVEASASPTEVNPGDTVTYTLDISNFEFDAYHCLFGPFLKSSKMGLTEGVTDKYVKVPHIPKDSAITVEFRAVANDDAMGKVTIFDETNNFKTEGVCGQFSRLEKVEADIPAICDPVGITICPCKVHLSSLLSLKGPKRRTTVPIFYFHPDKRWRINIQDMFEVRDLRKNAAHREWKELTRIFIDRDDRKPALPKLAHPDLGYPLSLSGKIQDIIARRRCDSHRSILLNLPVLNFTNLFSFCLLRHAMFELDCSHHNLPHYDSVQFAVYDGDVQMSFKKKMLISSVLHNHNFVNAQLRALCVQSGSTITQSNMQLCTAFIKNASTLWEQMRFHTSREFDGRNSKSECLFKPLEKNRFVAGVRYKVSMDDTAAAEMLRGLTDDITFPDFLEFLQKDWVQRNRGGDTAQSPKRGPTERAWFLLLHGELAITMKPAKSPSTSQKCDFFAGGRATVPPLFHLINSDLTEKYLGLVSTDDNSGPAKDGTDVWTSELTDGWTLTVTRTKSRKKNKDPGQELSWYGMMWECGTRYKLSYALENGAKKPNKDDKEFRYAVREISVKPTKVGTKRSKKK